MNRGEGAPVAIIGAGIAGLTLGLELQDAGIEFRIYESVDEFAPIGVGINVLPHGSAILGRLGLEERLAARGVVTQEAAFFNRFGQAIYREPSGRHAGYAWPQLSMHRGDLQLELMAALKERAGDDIVVMGHRCTGVDQDDVGATVRFRSSGGEDLAAVRARIVVSCDGVHSAVRRQFYPGEGDPRYSGINMWRGVTSWKPFLTGATMVRVGWIDPAKMVIYPVRNATDEQGNQLVNWAVEIQTPHHGLREWDRRGKLEDFIGVIEDWDFDWLDIPGMVRAAEDILEYPMVDQDPLPRWTFGRVTLLGDAAHPMLPRGSNGGNQAILDARELREQLEQTDDWPTALAAYESVRLPATSAVVRMNRTAPPDIVLKEVRDRTGDKPFDDINDVISPEELEQISERYKKVAGFSRSR